MAGITIGKLFPKVDDEPFKEIKEEKQAPKKKTTRKSNKEEDKED